MDTVEWGSVEPARRRLPALRYSLPRAGALALAAAGFAALVAAEMLPWGRVRLAPSIGATTSSSLTVVTDGSSLSLDTIPTLDGFVYHVSVLCLLGALGFGIAGSAVRRRAAMGAALGLAAGQLLTVLAVHQATLHMFDRFGAYGFNTGQQADASAVPTVVTGPGAYLAYASVALLSAAAVTAGIWQRGWWQSRSVAPATGAVPAAVRAPDGDRELTVSALEPVDESYFARPESR